MNQFFKSPNKALLSALKKGGWEMELDKAKARSVFISQETPEVKAFLNAVSFFRRASLLFPEAVADQNQRFAETTL
jgi:hypothetical protein